MKIYYMLSSWVTYNIWRVSHEPFLVHLCQEVGMAFLIFQVFIFSLFFSHNKAHYSTGAVAAGFTSTVMPRETMHKAAVVDEDVVRYERVKKKGYVRILTNFGSLNVELFADTVPKTCENFMKHCQNGYYNTTKFHRSIRNFMVSEKNIEMRCKIGKFLE